MKYYTYEIINKINKKKYIGWTNKNPLTKRLDIHFYSASKGSCLLLHNAMNKYGYENFNISLLGTFDNKPEALEDEIRLIAENKTNHCRFPNGGYNMTDGGEGCCGYKRSEEAILKTALANKGKPSNKKGKTYEEIYGKKAANERLKRSISHKGLKMTEEQKQHLSKKKMGNKNGCFPVKVTYDNGDIDIFPSRTEAMKALGIKSRTTLRSIETGLRYKNGKYEKYNSPYNFTVELLRHKI